MHACGHDVHVATLIGTARALAAARKNWHGTLMLVGQPAEESIDGAKAMLADGLYERFGRPDMAIALHDTNGHAAGTVGITSGPTQAGVNSIDVTLRGIGGHGAAPQDSIDPVVMAGQFLVQLQTIVSRMQNPRDPTVITVGSIHGGTRRNIIPYEVKMELTSRFFSEQASQTILDGVRRVAQSVALAAGAPADRQPIVTVIESESAPLTYNNPALAARVKAALVKSLGTDNVFDDEPVMYSEDFGFFGLPGLKIPSVIFGLGAVDPAAYAAARAAGKQVPGPHTSRWAPVPEATLGTGVRAMTAVAIALLQK
jgi:hippurate hydrolase